MPSETVPDQTLSIRQILDRYARGLPLDVKTGTYDDNYDIDDILPDPRLLDLSERQEMAENAKSEIQQIQEAVKRKKQIIVEPEILTPPSQLEN